jgi:hypothetical protein
MESLGFFAKAHNVPLDQLLREVRGAVDQPDVPSAAESAGPIAQAADSIYRPFFKAGMAVVDSPP